MINLSSPSSPLIRNVSQNDYQSIQKHITSRWIVHIIHIVDDSLILLPITNLIHDLKFHGTITCSQFSEILVHASEMTQTPNKHYKKG